VSTEINVRRSVVWCGVVYSLTFSVEFAASFFNHSNDVDNWSLCNIHIYIYIYIYVCVCVCVCVSRPRMRVGL